MKEVAANEGKNRFSESKSKSKNISFT